MKKCLREKCKKEFEPNKPKQVFCSDKCRVYNSRELKKNIPAVVIPGIPKQETSEPVKEVVNTQPKQLTFQQKMLNLKLGIK